MLTREQVQHIAKLARIELSEKELAQYQEDFSSILDYVDKLQEVDTKNVEEIGHITGLESVVRKDLAPAKQDSKKAGRKIARLMALAPAVQDGFVKVKAVFRND